MERIILIVLAILAVFAAIAIWWILRAPPGRETRSGYRSEPESPDEFSKDEAGRRTEKRDPTDSTSLAA